MDDNVEFIESIIERTTEYGKKSLDLVKLKVLYKTSDVVSTFLPHTVVIVFILIFMLFLDAGIALWLGEILGKIYFGFFIVAAFNGLAGIFIHLFLRKWLKNKVSNCLIKQVLK